MPQSNSISWYPEWKFGEPTNIPPRLIERLSLVLAGIDPSIIDTISSSQANHLSSGQRQATIQQLSLDPSTPHVSPSKLLSAPHRRILRPYYSVDQKQFAELWQASKTVAGGQDSTELIKAVHWLKKVAIDEKKSLENEVNRERALSAPKLAPKLLFYLFHNAVRRIERESHRVPPSTETPSLILRLLDRARLRPLPNVPTIYFPDTILHEAETYLISSIKLGKVLEFASQIQRRQRA